jgi:isocitrate dehydrogenase
MGSLSKGSRSHVSYMQKGDFYGSEQSAVIADACQVQIQHIGADGKTKILKDFFPIQKNEIIDASYLSINELKNFYEKEINDAFKDHILLSLHLKATMMKVSDPIMFGHCVKVYYKSVFEKHANLFKELNVNANNGLNDVLEKTKNLPENKRLEIEKDIVDCYHERPWLAMVNSDKGITNLHVPNDVIIDASMPVVIRDSGELFI